MDFLIATKFLGQEIPEVCQDPEVRVTMRGGWEKVGEYCWEKEEPVYENGAWICNSRTGWWPQPYSVNMFLLTELLKKLDSDGYSIGMEVWEGSVYCNIVHGGTGDCVAKSFADSIKRFPLAVCRACLNLIERIQGAN